MQGNGQMPLKMRWNPCRQTNWDLVDLAVGRNAIGNKRVLKIKQKADGSTERYKIHLVAKGYTQREGVVQTTRNFLPNGKICLDSHDTSVGRSYGSKTCLAER